VLLCASVPLWLISFLSLFFKRLLPMSFHSGRVTFCRFFANGDGPTTADDTALATLAEHSFQETEIGAPDAVESGWTTGEHLFDTQFTYEKNGYGNAMLFALRIDTH